MAWGCEAAIPALEHLGNFRLGERFGKDPPCLGRFDVDGWVVMDAIVEEEPPVKAAEATQLSRGGTRVNTVVAKMFEEPRDIGLGGSDQECVALFKKLGEDAQIAEISFAGERPQSFFYP